MAIKISFEIWRASYIIFINLMIEVNVGFPWSRNIFFLLSNRRLVGLLSSDFKFLIYVHISRHTSLCNICILCIEKELLTSFYEIIKQYFSNWCRIFRLRGYTKCLGGPIFRGWNEVLLLDKALTFGVIFQKYALKLIKNLKNIENIREKCRFLRKSFNFLAGHKFVIMGKINNLIWTCCNGGLGGRSPPKVEKISGNLSKSVM